MRPKFPPVQPTRVQSALFIAALAILVLGIGFAVVQSGAVEALNVSGILRE